jgi:hypothetical protein
LEQVKAFLEYILASLDNVNKGASGKKLTALVITITYCYSHRFIDASNLPIVLGVDASLILALFGINVIEKIKTNGENN